MVSFVSTMPQSASQTLPSMPQLTPDPSKKKSTHSDRVTGLSTLVQPFQTSSSVTQCNIQPQKNGNLQNGNNFPTTSRLSVRPVETMLPVPQKENRTTQTIPSVVNKSRRRNRNTYTGGLQQKQRVMHPTQESSMTRQPCWRTSGTSRRQPSQLQQSSRNYLPAHPSLSTVPSQQQPSLLEQSLTNLVSSPLLRPLARQPTAPNCSTTSSPSEWLSLDEAVVLYAKLGKVPEENQYFSYLQTERAKRTSRWHSMSIFHRPLASKSPKLRAKPLSELLDKSKPSSGPYKNLLDVSVQLSTSSTKEQRPATAKDDLSLLSCLKTSPAVGMQTLENKLLPCSSVTSNKSDNLLLPVLETAITTSKPVQYSKIPSSGGHPSSLDIISPLHSEVIYLDSPENTEIKEGEIVSSRDNVILGVTNASDKSSLTTDGLNVKNNTEEVRVFDGKAYPVLDTNDIIVPVPVKIINDSLHVGISPAKNTAGKHTEVNEADSSINNKMIKLFGEEPDVIHSASKTHKVQIESVMKDYHAKKRKKNPNKNQEHRKKKNKLNQNILEVTDIKHSKASLKVTIPQNISVAPKDNERHLKSPDSTTGICEALNSVYSNKPIVPDDRIGVKICKNKNDLTSKPLICKDVIKKSITETKVTSSKRISTIKEFDMFASTDKEKKESLLIKKKKRRINQELCESKFSLIIKPCFVKLQRCPEYDRLALKLGAPEQRNVEKLSNETFFKEPHSCGTSASSESTIRFQKVSTLHENRVLLMEVNANTQTKLREMRNKNIKQFKETGSVVSGNNISTDGNEGNSPVQEKLGSSLLNNLSADNVIPSDVVPNSLLRESVKCSLQSSISQEMNQMPVKKTIPSSLEDVASEKVCVLSSPHSLEDVEDPERRWNLDSFMPANRSVTIARPELGDVIVASTTIIAKTERSPKTKTSSLSMSLKEFSKVNENKSMCSVSDPKQDINNKSNCLLEPDSGQVSEFKMTKSHKSFRLHSESSKSDSNSAVVPSLREKELQNRRPNSRFPAMTGRHKGLPLVTSDRPLVYPNPPLSQKLAPPRAEAAVDTHSISDTTADSQPEVSTTPICPHVVHDARLQNATYCGISSDMLRQRRPSNEAVDATRAFLRVVELPKPPFKGFLCTTCKQDFNDYSQWTGHLCQGTENISQITKVPQQNTSSPLPLMTSSTLPAVVPIQKSNNGMVNLAINKIHPNPGLNPPSPPKKS